MKNLSSLRDFKVNPDRRFVRITLLLGGAAVALAVQQLRANQVAAEPKNYTLFMGADFDLQQNQQFFRVDDVAGRSFVYKKDDAEVKVPMNRGHINMKVVEELKLTKSSALISNLTTERAYTPARDPNKKFMRENPGDATAVLQEQAQNVQLNYSIANGMQEAYGFGRPPGQVVATAQGQLTAPDSVNTAMMNANVQQQSFSNNAGTYAGRLESDLDKGLFDAVEVKFTVSSSKPFYKPYVVLIAQYRAADDKVDTVRNWIYAKEIEPIDEHPRKERFFQGGLPPGFKLIKCDFHLYDHGHELATNVSSKRVPLTQEEAFEYLVIEYVGSHKGATLPPSPVMGELPSDLYAKLSADQVRASYYVKVTSDGLPQGVYTDQACREKLQNEDIQAAVENMRFQPALKNGKPVPGVTTLKLNHLPVQA